MGNGCSSDHTTGLSVQDKIPSFKVVLVGDPGVGKTSLFLRYIKHQFNYDYIPTTQVSIENVVRKLNVPENAVVSVTMWDLPGREDMDLRKTYYQDLDAAIVVVDLTDVDSIELASTWKQEVLNNAFRKKVITEVGKDGVQRIVSTEEIPVDPKTLPILLAGNKYDLVLEKVNEEKAKKDEEKMKLDEEKFKLALALTLNAERKDSNEDGDHSETENEDEHDAEDVEREKKVRIADEALDEDNAPVLENTNEDQLDDKEDELEALSEEKTQDDTQNPTEPTEVQGDDKEEEKPACVQLLESVAAEHDFLGSVLVSAKDPEGSVHTSVQSLIRHMLQKTMKVAEKKPEKEKKTKKKDFSKEEWSMKDVGLVQFDDLFKRINVFMERCNLYNGYYSLALSKFKRACLEAEVVSYINESHCSIEDCITGLKTSIGSGNDLTADDEEGFLHLNSNPLIKVDLRVQSALRCFNSEYSAICKVILHEYPTLSMALQKLDEKVGGESEQAWDIMTEAGKTQMDVRKIMATIEKNRAQLAIMQNQITQHLSYAENAKKKIVAALIW